MEIERQIKDIEIEMSHMDFWNDAEKAKKQVKVYEELKSELRKQEEILKGGAILSIFTGAGGLDAEDFTKMLFEMYLKYCDKNDYHYFIIDKNENSFSGYKYISIQIEGKNVYKKLKNETGVHRLIRQSPFNAKDLRQTSFSYVEVLPILKNDNNISINTNDLLIDTSKSSGPGGQNVNKRETAVRITHIPTKITVTSSTERSQAQNKEIALEILKGKLYLLEEEKNKKIKEGYVGDFKKGEDIEWGRQRRTYTLHPYKLIKDHILNIETSQIDDVLYNGNIDIFIQ